MRPTSEGTTATALESLLQEQAAVGDWRLDEAQSTIRLLNKSLRGLVSVKGVFRDVSGHGTVFANGEVSGTLTVAAASVDTRNSRRDKHLRSADFFNTDVNPDITFTAEGIRPSHRGAEVTGLLTVRGRTRPLCFEADVTVPAEDEVGLDAEVHVRQADFGLTWNLLGLVGMTTTLIIRAVFTRE